MNYSKSNRDWISSQELFSTILKLNLWFDSQKICQSVDIEDEKVLQNLQKAQTALERAEILQQYLVFSLDSSVSEKLIISVLSKDLEYIERVSKTKEALDEIQDLSLSLLEVGGICKNTNKIRNDIQINTNSLVSSIVEISASYPDISKSSTSKFQKWILGILNPNRIDEEDKIIAIFSFFELIKPCLVERILSFQTYDTNTHQWYREEIFQDVCILIDFYNCIKDAVAFAINKKSQTTESELAEKLFQIGPLFVKLTQSFAEVIPQTESHLQKMAKYMSGIFQEGIAKPDKETAHMNIQSAYKGNIPRELILKDPISSASIAQVIWATYKEVDIALKIKRPNVDISFSKNVRLYKVISEILISFTKEYEKSSELTQVIDDISKELPFLLEVLERSFEIEFNFEAEQKAQNKAFKILKDYKWIIIPQVIPEISNNNVIAMGRKDGYKIANLPANPEILKNIFILLFVLWKNKLLHGDLHGWNLKGTEKWEIIVYDWGQHSEIAQGFLKNIGLYLFALAIKKPKTIAKYYCLLQDPYFSQATEFEIEEIVNIVLETQRKRTKVDINLDDNNGLSEKIHLKVSKYIKETVELQRMILVTAGLRHQSVIDRNTTHFIRSGASLFSILTKELSKPEYGGIIKKILIISKNFNLAIKDVSEKGN